MFVQTGDGVAANDACFRVHRRFSMGQSASRARMALVAALTIGAAVPADPVAAPTERVTGIGGVFFRALDPKATEQWYRDNLGIPWRPLEGGQSVNLFQWFDLSSCGSAGGASAPPANTVWSAFAADSDYLKPSDAPFMINYRVRDLEKMLSQLRSRGVSALSTETAFNGKFAWVLDNEGRKIELWEPAPGY
jgi:predicted enzyme related to lactoylglutathione lyase